MQKIKELIFKINNNLIVRYAISGGLSSAIDIILFFILNNYFNLHYSISAFISVSTSFILRFILQRKYAFRNKDNNDIKRQFINYSILYAMSMILTLFFLYIFIDIIHIHKTIAQILSIIIIAGISFFVYKYLIFNKKEEIEIK